MVLINIQYSQPVKSGENRYEEVKDITVIFLYIFSGLECVGHSFASPINDFWGMSEIEQSAAVASAGALPT